MSFNVKFSSNGNILGSLQGNDNMIISELLLKFCQANNLNEGDKVTFTFQSKELKPTSCKNLKELEITSDSTIEVKSEKTLIAFQDPGNAGNSQVPQNNFPFMMNNNNYGMMFNQNMPMNQNMNNYGMMFNQNMPMNQNMNNYGMMFNQNIPMNQNNNNFGMMFYQNMPMNQNVNYYGMMFNQNMNNQNNINQNMNNQNNINQNMNNQNIVNQNNTNQNINNQNVNINQNNNNVQPASEDSNFINIVFINQNQLINIQATKKDKFCDIAKRYCNKALLGDRVPSFLYNSKKLERDESKTLEELEIKGNPRIDVIFNAEIIGA